MSEWREVNLDEIVKFQRGHDLTVANIEEGNYPVAGSNGVIGYHNQFTTVAPGITLGRSGNSIGVAHYYGRNFWAHNTTLYTTAFIRSWPKYVFYFLRTIDFAALNSGSAVPSLNRNHIHSIRVIIPDLTEQKSIAAVLNSLDDKIDLLHRQNQTLEAMAATLFRQWFVEEAGEDWEEVTLDDVISVKGGTTPSTKEPAYWDGDIPWTSPRDLSNHDSVFMFDTVRKITEHGLAQIGSGLLPVGTVLLSSRAPIGYLAIADIPVAINQGYIAIVCDKILSNHFMFLWCKANMEEIKNAGNGSTFEEISKSTFKALRFVMPLKERLWNFDETVSPTFEKIKTNQKQIRTLETLRDTLLPKLMSGAVRVALDRAAA